MNKYVDEARLLDALKTFYKVTRLKVTVYSPSQEVIMEYPITNSKLCNYLHTYDYCTRLCHDSNYNAFLKMNECIKNGKYIYTCYAGLIEAIVPLIKDNEIIGYVMFGQVVNSENKDNVYQSLEKLKGKIDVDDAKKLVPFIRCHNDEMLEAEAKLLVICSKYFIQDSIVRKKNSNILDQITAYINNKKFDNFSIYELSSLLSISRTKLYTIFKNEYHIGIAEYIRNLKLEEAERFILKTNYSINKITEMVNFNDANSFIKIFKKKYGVTPAEYRKLKPKITNDN